MPLFAWGEAGGPSQAIAPFTWRDPAYVYQAVELSPRFMEGDDPAAPRSVLSLFAAPGAAPQGLTAFDRAYLRMLYKLPRTAFAEEVLAETVRIAAK